MKSAQAGRKSDALPPPQGGAVSLGTTDIGSMGFARASADTNQLVRCDVMAHDDDPVNPTPGWTTIRCTFIDQNGNPARCVSSSQAIINAVNAIGDAKLAITLKSNGDCATATVIHSSEYEPKVP